MVIFVKDHIQQCYSNADGDKIYTEIRKFFEKQQNAVISFVGIDSISTSFANSAFIELLDKYDFSYIKSHLVIQDSTKQINEMIKRRFDFEVSHRNNLINI